MKKILIICVVALLASPSVFATENLDTDLFGKRVETIKLDGSKAEGKLKAGVVLGYPTGLTAGWRPSDVFELNLVVASHYTDFTIGLSPMFTIVNLDIEGEIFPISVGPAAYLSIDWLGNIDVDVLGSVRMEYTFRELPVNLFLEGGLGFKVDLGFGIRFHGSGAFGIRYVF